MRGTYEIKSKATGKVIYSAGAEDIAADFNKLKRQLIMGWCKEKKLTDHKLGVADLYLSLPEVKSAPKPAAEKKEAPKRKARK